MSGGGNPGGILAGLASVPVIGRLFGRAPCPLATHFVKVTLKYRDTGEDVPAAKCRILRTQSTINGGPLAAGSLESRQLPANTYSVTFLDIDAAEWG